MLQVLLLTHYYLVVIGLLYKAQLDDCQHRVTNPAQAKGPAREGALALEMLLLIHSSIHLSMHPSVYSFVGLFAHASNTRLLLGSCLDSPEKAPLRRLVIQLLTYSQT